jgi:hypothetical protein
LFTFAWTTSALVDVVASNRRLLEQLEDEREQEMHMRVVLRKKEWAALRAERDAEHALKERFETPAPGSSLIQKVRIWRGERKRVADLRREKVAEMEDLLRQERLKERENRAASGSTEHKVQK